MVNSVTPPLAYLCSGNTYTDDTNPSTGLDNYGYTSRLIPLFSDGVKLVDYAVGRAAAAAASASAADLSAQSALNAPGTNATQTSGSVAIGTGSKTFTIQSGKAYAVGQTLVAASAADPSNFMAGQVTAYSGTSLTLNVTQSNGSGSKSDFVFSMGAIVSSSFPAQSGATNGKFLQSTGAAGAERWFAAMQGANNLSEVTDKPTARSNLDLIINTHVQQYDAGLYSIANLTTAADKMIYTTASDTYATTTLTTYGRSLIDDVDAAAARTTLGAQASHANLATLASLTLAADKLAYATGAGTMALTNFTSFARTLVDDGDATTARGTLGAAASGLNSDITSLTGLTTALSAAQGGTGVTSLAALLAALPVTGGAAVEFQIGSLYVKIGTAASTLSAAGAGPVSTTITFTTPFPSACIAVWPVSSFVSGTQGAAILAQVDAISRFGATVYATRLTGSGVHVMSAPFIALGY